MTHELPDHAHPTYTEFSNNIYSDIFGLNGGALLHANIATSNYKTTYAIYNVTNETISRVQNNIYLIEGYQHDTVLLMQNITVEDAFGNADFATLVQQTKGALMTCSNCTVTRQIDSSDKIKDIETTFKAKKWNYRLRERNSFYDYLE